MKLCCNNFQKLVLKKYTQNKRSWRLLYNKINWVLGGRMMPWSLLVFWIPHGTAFFWLCYWLVPGPSLHYSFFPPACFLTFLFLSVVFSFSSLWDSFTTHLCNSNQQPVKILWTGTATKEYVITSVNLCFGSATYSLRPLEWTSGIPCALENQENSACWD